MKLFSQTIAFLSQENSISPCDASFPYSHNIQATLERRMFLHVPDNFFYRELRRTSCELIFTLYSKIHIVLQYLPLYIPLVIHTHSLSLKLLIWCNDVGLEETRRAPISTNEFSKCLWIYRILCYERTSTTQRLSYMAWITKTFFLSP